MKTLRKVILPLIALTCCSTWTVPVFATEEKTVQPSPAPSGGRWLTDFKKAAEEAKTHKKILLLDFTGSDWCGWCIKLDKEVFDKPEFKQYAKENLVLLTVDFPNRKRLSPKVQKQNQELKKQYGIRSYPTIIVLNPEGKKIGDMGYMQGGPQKFIGELDKLKARGDK